MERTQIYLTEEERRALAAIAGRTGRTQSELIREAVDGRSARGVAGARGDEDEGSLKQFLLAFAILPVTEKVARLGGLYRRDFGPGHGTGLADALIAATAVENGVNLVTFNRRHHPMVSRIAVPYER